MVRIGKGNPILFVLMLSFFVFSCGLPQDPVYVRGEYEISVEDSVEDSIDSISVFINFDGEHIYGDDVIHTDGFNVYYNYSNIVLTDPQNYSYEYFLCYNATGDMSDKPAIPLTYNDVFKDGSFEFSYNKITNTASISHAVLHRNNENTFNTYDDEDDFSGISIEDKVFINFFIEYYVKRENDGVSDSTERKHINSYTINEFE
ncbi:MAG: hypothetical protein K9L75_00485 [Spirochaetia bacterium]|nr:hypothetical protein [Spirochaetia bacterium]